MLETSLELLKENYRKGLKLNPTTHSSVPLSFMSSCPSFFSIIFPYLKKNKKEPSPTNLGCFLHE